MEQIIGVKQLHQELKEIAKRVEGGESFVVVKHAKPIFRLTPYRKDESNAFIYTLQDLKRLQFSMGEKDISQKIDKIVYEQ